MECYSIYIEYYSTFENQKYQISFLYTSFFEKINFEKLCYIQLHKIYTNFSIFLLSRINYS